MTFELSLASRKRASTRNKEKSTEREESERKEHNEHIDDVEKSKKKYESRNHILENKMRE